MCRFLLFAGVALVGVLFYGVQPLVWPGAPSPTFRVVTAADAPVLTRHLARFDAQLGADKEAYLNHCLRTLSFAEEFLRRDFGFSEEAIAARRPVMETALAFHDIALWSDGALDYLEPSAAQAQKLAGGDFTQDERDVVADIILQHHKITEFSGGKDDAVVNAVRLADWLDFTQNAGFCLRSGMASGNIAAANAALPKLGFIDVLGGFPARLSPDDVFGGNMEVMKIYKW